MKPFSQHEYDREKYLTKRPFGWRRSMGAHAGPFRFPLLNFARSPHEDMPYVEPAVVCTLCGGTSPASTTFNGLCRDCAPLP